MRFSFFITYFTISKEINNTFKLKIMTTSNKQIASTILSQLGGNKFIAMTGSKNFVAIESGLTMKLTRNKISATWLRIKLTPMDDYTMEFIGRTGKVKKSFEGVYCDMLQDIFTDVTGLYTSL